MKEKKEFQIIAEQNMITVESEDMPEVLQKNRLERFMAYRDLIQNSVKEDVKCTI